MDNLYEKLMRNIGYTLKSVLNEDIQNFDVSDYSDDNIIDTQDISNLTEINTTDDVLELVTSFVKRYNSLCNKLRIALNNIMTSRKVSKEIQNQYIIILKGFVDIQQGNNSYSTCIDDKLWGDESYEDDDIDNWYHYILYAIINNDYYKSFVKKYENDENDVYYDEIKDKIDSSYDGTILNFKLNVDSWEYEKIDYNGICTLLSEFYKNNKQLNIYNDYPWIQLDYGFSKNAYIIEELDNFINILENYINFVINNFEKYVNYKKRFNDDDYDPETYLDIPSC